MAQIVPLNQPGMAPPPARPEPRRNHWGQYLIPDPQTGQDRPWIRATTWAKSVADTHALTRWEIRQVCLGLARRPDLLVRVAAVIDPESKDGKRELDGLAERAKEHALGGAGANIGKALHSLAEAYDLGRPLPQIPEPFDKDLAAYQEAMRGVKVSQNYIEKIGLVHELGVAGTMDRVVAFGASKLPLIGDLKTGKDLDFSWTEIVIQLALYAHADTVFDPLTEQHRPMLPVDQKQALVIWLPAGKAHCELFMVDIAAGWEMAEDVCQRVRKWRNRKDLAKPLLVVEGGK